MVRVPAAMTGPPAAPCIRAAVSAALLVRRGKATAVSCLVLAAAGESDSHLCDLAAFHSQG